MNKNDRYYIGNKIQAMGEFLISVVFAGYLLSITYILPQKKDSF